MPHKRVHDPENCPAFCLHNTASFSRRDGETKQFCSAVDMTRDCPMNFPHPKRGVRGEDMWHCPRACSMWERCDGVLTCEAKHQGGFCPREVDYSGHEENWVEHLNQAYEEYLEATRAGRKER